MNTTAPEETRPLTVDEAAAWLSISRTTFYELVKAGEIPTAKARQRTLVRLQDLQDYIDRQITPRPVAA